MFRLLSSKSVRSMLTILQSDLFSRYVELKVSTINSKSDEVFAIFWQYILISFDV